MGSGGSVAGSGSGSVMVMVTCDGSIVRCSFFDFLNVWRFGLVGVGIGA